MVLDYAPITVSQNSQFFRPTAKGRIAFPAGLLEIGTLPLVRNAFNASHCFLHW